MGICLINKSLNAVSIFQAEKSTPTALAQAKKAKRLSLDPGGIENQQAVIPESPTDG